MFNTKTNTNKMNVEDRAIVAKILSALGDSSLANELQLYATAVKTDLNIDDETMTRVFSFSVFAEACMATEKTPTTKRMYRGQLLENYEQESKTTQVATQGATRVTTPVGTRPPTPVIVTTQVATQGATQGATQDPPQVTERAPTPVSAPVSTRMVERATPEPTPEPTSTRQRKVTKIPPLVVTHDMTVSESESEADGKKNNDPSAKALRKLLRVARIPTTFTLNTIKYEKAIMLSGSNTKKYRDDLKTMGGKWNGVFKAFVFSKHKVIEAAESLKKLKQARTTSEVEDADAEVEQEEVEQEDAEAEEEAEEEEATQKFEMALHAHDE